jgi:hypothetical protein
MESIINIIIKWSKSRTEKRNKFNLLISLKSAIKKSLMSGVKRERERERERAEPPTKEQRLPHHMDYLLN